ncbi:CNT_collapsed_G0015760.mRNA.1.CDS.1 [Saccharomyces cerevisiae]|nr:CNT_collapsed_G0015760.mRNA.1.CDS.1 [Saccharomyces cerevisiae]
MEYKIFSCGSPMVLHLCLEKILVNGLDPFSPLSMNPLTMMKMLKIRRTTKQHLSRYGMVPYEYH